MERGTVTLRIGLAARSEEMTEVDELLRLAEAALYQAKRTGKDRICVAAEAMA